jgi:RNA polymerase sigma-70 factor (ECF subfamily)
MRLRPRLFGIAYRMLSSASEAEDRVQEVWLRWQKYHRSPVANPAPRAATATPTPSASVDIGPLPVPQKPQSGE